MTIDGSPGHLARRWKVEDGEHLERSVAQSDAPRNAYGEFTGAGSEPWSVRRRIKEILQWQTTAEVDGQTVHLSRAQKVALALVQKAEGGHVQAAELVLAQVDGPVQAISSPNLTVQIAYVDHQHFTHSPEVVPIPLTAAQPHSLTPPPPQQLEPTTE